MDTQPDLPNVTSLEDEELLAPVEFHFGLGRRAFIQVVSAGFIVTVGALPALGQAASRRRGGGGATTDPAGRIQIGKEGRVTVLTGKVEVGQGARAELIQAAAEELRLPPSRIQLVMGDTSRVPNDGITAGSRTTPSTVPVVRQAAALTREVLCRLAAGRWGVERDSVEASQGAIIHPASQRSMSFGQLAQGDDLVAALRGTTHREVSLTKPEDFQTLGTSVPRPNARDLITGAHIYASDVQRPGMLYGRVLRAPAQNTRLQSVDLEPARRMEGVVGVRDGDFVGVCARTSFQARKALEAVAATASWETGPHPASTEVYDYLRQHVRGGMPENPFTSELAAAAKRLRQTYHVAYVQHAPMETRAAVAEWVDGKLTVWTGTQNPFGVRRELSRAFRLAEDKVRVVMPDTGGGFGGKHTGETAIEAARLAQAVGKPVLMRWTREEEFTWAYFRPAAVIDIEASLNQSGRLTSWHFVNVNAGRSGVPTPYRCEASRSQDVRSEAPLRQGSYRALGSTGSNFARECFMDELAARAGADPLDFRLRHLDESENAQRLRGVLEEAVRRFNWRERVKEKRPDAGVGLACGTEKGSFVAACAEVAIDRQRNTLVVREVCEVFECGTIYNPDNLRAQVEGAILMGLGPVLREEIRFQNGRISNPRFSQYGVPRFSDVPKLDIHLLNRTDLPAVGGGETPIMAIAPAVANAVFHATGKRVRALPIRLDNA